MVIARLQRAADADEQGGLSLVFADGSKTYIISVLGTSASAPLWGGVMALVGKPQRAGARPPAAPRK